MLSYCQDLHSCRRSLIGQHFGEEWNNDECKGMCDNCKRTENGEFVEFVSFYCIVCNISVDLLHWMNGKVCACTVQFYDAALVFTVINFIFPSRFQVWPDGIPYNDWELLICCKHCQLLAVVIFFSVVNMLVNLQLKSEGFFGKKLWHLKIFGVPGVGKSDIACPLFLLL